MPPTTLAKWNETRFSAAFRNQSAQSGSRQDWGLTCPSKKHLVSARYEVPDDPSAPVPQPRAPSSRWRDGLDERCYGDEDYAGFARQRGAGDPVCGDGYELGGQECATGGTAPDPGAPCISSTTQPSTAAYKAPDHQTYDAALASDPARRHGGREVWWRRTRSSRSRRASPTTRGRSTERCRARCCGCARGRRSTSR